jgi:hypothetical protein
MDSKVQPGVFFLAEEADRPDGLIAEVDGPDGGIESPPVQFPRSPYGGRKPYDWIFAGIETNLVSKRVVEALTKSALTGWLRSRSGSATG